MISLSEILDWMDLFHSQLVSRHPLPQRASFKNGFVYHYAEQTLEQVIIQKLARLASGLRAGHALLDLGFLQEQAAICRIVDEFQEDVIFLSLGILDGGDSARHEQYRSAFYEGIRNDGIASTEIFERKNLVPRKKIRAYIVNHRLSVGDPSGGISAMNALGNALSGYVHGSSFNIMEMYQPHPPKFLTNGMRTSHHYPAHQRDFANYVYRGIMAYCYASNAIGSKELSEESYRFLVRYEKHMGGQ